jgi:hypothetical protein
MEPIRAAIVDAMNEVSNIGKVHAYERYSSDMATLASLYQTDDLLLGWFISRGRVSETSPFSGRRVEQIEWKIMGYRGFVDADATEMAFDDLIDNIRIRFRTSDTFGGAWPWGFEKYGIQVDETGPVLFAGVLCHSAKLSLPTTRYITEN